MKQKEIVKLLTRFVTENYSFVHHGESDRYIIHTITLRDDMGRIAVRKARHFFMNEQLGYRPYVKSIVIYPSSHNHYQLEHWETLARELNGFRAFQLRRRLLRFTRTAIKNEQVERVKEALVGLGGE